MLFVKYYHVIFVFTQHEDVTFYYVIIETIINYCERFKFIILIFHYFNLCMHLLVFHIKMHYLKLNKEEKQYINLIKNMLKMCMIMHYNN